jgi:hypothetical protein
LGAYANREADDASLVEEDYVTVILINEVFYARAIDVTFHRDESAGISAKYSHPKPKLAESSATAADKAPQSETQNKKEANEAAGAGGGNGNSAAAGSAETAQEPRAPTQNDSPAARSDEAQTNLSALTTPGVALKAFFGES